MEKHDHRGGSIGIYVISDRFPKRTGCRAIIVSAGIGITERRGTESSAQEKGGLRDAKTRQHAKPPNSHQIM